MYSPEAIPAMQGQGGKTCPCHCIPRFLPWVFFLLQNCAYLHARRVDKKPISVAPISPPAPSSKPLDTPLLPVCPFSQRPSEGAAWGLYFCPSCEGTGERWRRGGNVTKPIPSTKTVARHDDNDDDDIAAVSVVVPAALKTTINRQWLTTRRVMEGQVMAVRGVGKHGEGGGARRSHQQW